MLPLRMVILLLALLATAMGQIDGPFTDHHYGPAYQVATTPAPDDEEIFYTDSPPTVAFTTGLHFAYNFNLTDEGGAVDQLGHTFRIPKSGLYWIQLTALRGSYSQSSWASIWLKVNNAGILQIRVKGVGWKYGANTAILRLMERDVLSVEKGTSDSQFYSGGGTDIESEITGIKISDF